MYLNSNGWFRCIVILCMFCENVLAQSTPTIDKQNCMISGGYTPAFENVRGIAIHPSSDGKTHLIFPKEPTSQYKILKENGEVLSFTDKSRAEAMLAASSAIKEVPQILFDAASKKVLVKIGSEVQEFEMSEADWGRGQLSTILSQDKNTLVINTKSVYKNNQYRGVDREITVIDLKTKLQKKIQVLNTGEFLGWPERPSTHFLLHPKGSHLLFWSVDNGKIQVNLKDGSIKKVKSSAQYFDGQGRLCGRASSRNEAEIPRLFRRFDNYVCFDQEGGSEFIIPIKSVGIAPRVENLGENRVLVLDSVGVIQSASVLNYKQICSDKVQVDCGCDVPKIQGAGVSGVSDIRSMSLEALCQADLEVSRISNEEAAKQWDKLTGPIKSRLTESEGLLWLKRFAKPEGLDLNVHLGTLRGLIGSGFAKAYPDDMAAALSNVASKSEILFDSLVTTYPQVFQLKLSQNPKVCRSEKDKQKMKQGIYDIVMEKFKSAFRPHFDDLQGLSWLVNLNLDDTQKENLSEVGAYALTETTTDSYEARNIFASKIYKFSYHNLKKAFRLPYRDLTDLTLRRVGGRLEIIKLTLDPSSQPGGERLAGGFGIEKIDEVNISDIEKTNNIVLEKKWAYKGKQYKAKMDLKMEELKGSIVTAKPGPDYASMWKDGEFRTVVVAGANLGEHLTESTMKEYISYYSNQGFEMSAPKEMEDLPKYLESKTSGQGQMDVFIKEAHSDGDEKNLFRVSKRAKIVVGKKKTPKGEEWVEIIYPALGSQVHISNRDFGEWMRKRVSSDGGELLYLNSSCWSQTKAVYEVGAAATEKLLNVPTSTSMQVFQDHPKNIMRLALDGVRGGKNFAELRKTFMEDEGYSSGKKNRFIFPDEKGYTEKITDVAAKPLNIKMGIEELVDSHWTPYSIEDH